jgi:MFS transporter, FHS family, glucose/mannose:H+ symporter
MVEPVSRTSLSAGPGGRAVVYAAVGLEGAVVVTFFVAVQLLLNRDYFSLSTAQYGAVYVPVFAAAVLAALLAVRRSRAAARGSVFRLGLTLTAVGRAAMIPTAAGAIRHAAVFFPDLVIIGALTGAGFALVYSAATTFALDIDPARPERQLLRLTLRLAAGMVVGPLLQIGLIEAGLWWAFPVIALALAVLLIAVSSRSRLGPDAGRSCALRHPAKRTPAWVKVYLLVAFLALGGVVISVAWSQVGFMGPMTDSIGPRVLVLGAFWAALAVLARAAFSAIDMQVLHRREAILGLFLLPAVVTAIGLAIGLAETAVVGIFLLAAVVCAAFLPPESQLTERQLGVLPLVVVAGVIGIYPVAIALARPSLSGLRSSGATLPMIFAMAGLVAIFACLICARLIGFRRVYAVPAGPGTTAADRRRPLQEPPTHARSCTAVEVPRQKMATRQDKDQPDTRSKPRHR